MNIVLWVLQGLLAVAFLAAGTGKLVRRKEDAQKQMAWMEDFSQPTIRLIGASEVLAALGLILPAATGIAPVLTPLAATGLVVVMVGAIVLHVRRREPRGVATAAVLLVLAAVVAWGRFGPYAF
jgi:uncharacterized membrane protein YphA (DoxX/SURF4 family)